MSTLVVTRGIPGSGKSTWSRRWVKQQAGVRVNRDDLRWMLHGARTYTRDAEQQVTAAQRAQVEALLRHGVHVVVDDTNLRGVYVRNWRDLTHRCGAGFEIADQFLAIPVDECIRRDAARRPRDRVGAAFIRVAWNLYLAEGAT